MKSGIRKNYKEGVKFQKLDSVRLRSFVPKRGRIGSPVRLLLHGGTLEIEMKNVSDKSLHRVGT